jgi:YggT family protein
MGSAFTDIGLLIVNTLSGLFLFVVVLRFLLQAVRADFYNPLSQFIVKASNPLLLPIRKLVPGLGGYDIASLVLAVLVQLVAISLTLSVLGVWPLPILNIAIWSVLGTAGIFLDLYFWGLLIIIIISWVAPNNPNPVIDLLKQIIEPVMKPIRKVMPDMGGLDLSPIIVIMVLRVAETLLGAVAKSAGYQGQFPIIGL